MIILKDEPRKKIDKQIPLEVRRYLGELTIEAYRTSKLLMENTPALQFPRARKLLLPELKNIMLEFMIIQAVKNNKLPFNYRINFNSNHSHPYLELYNDDILIHFNQVRTKSSCARKAIFRDKILSSVQTEFVFDEEVSSDDLFSDKTYYQFNHGYQTETPQFITLGIPNNMYEFEVSVPILEEYAAIEGRYPTSTKEELHDDFDDKLFEKIQQYAEGKIEDERAK
ncbi:hypothetical protein [Marinococcus luteus]|uniref:hypothetical protein n=1 Tax=Marinococcus luteus TaxID=1122204 RepID=UPI002ACC68E3|nr:hypothetical protein [Marinococcus luteus]MDZ5782088.1 hypothetical protein [Marinococcus luteus]